MGQDWGLWAYNGNLLAKIQGECKALVGKCNERKRQGRLCYARLVDDVCYAQSVDDI